MLIDLKELLENKKNYLKFFEKEIVVYPTDTVYGIGCNAYSKDLVDKIYEIKKRDREKPLSIIAPNFDFIYENFILDYDIKKYLPGPYTLILEKKDKSFLKHIHKTHIGVRIINHKIQAFFNYFGKPFITSSYNESSCPVIEDPKKKILKGVDLLVYDGVIKGRPSTIIKDGKVIIR